MEFVECNASLVLYPFLLLIILSSQYIPNSPSSPLSNHNQQINGSSITKIENGLARSRAAIRTASQTVWQDLEQLYVPPLKHTDICHLRIRLSYQEGSFTGTLAPFIRSYTEMEKRFKIWVYREGEPPLFHSGPFKDIYSIEGHFIGELENGKSPFIAHHPDEAVAFFLPFSVTDIVINLYLPVGDYDRKRLQNVVTDYVYVISNKYEYWNRSRGADHFFVGCHDWAPFSSRANPKLLENMIRVLCNANASEGFNPARDASLVEIKSPPDGLGPPLNLGQPPTNRSILAFFAGGPHGYARKILFKYWKEKDKDIQVYEYLPKDKNQANYFETMGRTKFCLCPSGYEVASPRVIESIYSGCVPVIISDGYVLPFSEVLDWSRFSVHIPVAKIPAMKKILEGISMDEYLRKQKHVMQVQRHFVLHRPAQPYDLLHMILHSVWLRRLNIRVS